MSDQHTIDDGGSAFPTLPEHHGYPPGIDPDGTPAGPGMSLRDYFAARALDLALATVGHRNYEDDVVVKMTAAICYEIADAMILASKAGDTK